MATVTAIEYSGLIWCPTVSTGAFVARRNGKVFITGNSGFPKSLNVSKAIDKAAGAEREVVGSKLGQPGYSLKQNDTDKHERKAYGKFTDAEAECAITAPATDAARRWEGWGTSLKPAIEPIIVARKPLIGTVAENVLVHGTGALNIGGCRVPPDGADDDAAYRAKCESVVGLDRNRNGVCYGEMPGKRRDSYSAEGRFPSNLIHDGSPEVVALFPDSKGSGGSVPNVKITGYGGGAVGTGESKYLGGERTKVDCGSGSAARFFKQVGQPDDDDLAAAALVYCAKPSRAERDRGLDGFELRAPLHGKANTAGGLSCSGSKRLRANTHPTVKPVELMRYLCRLVTQPGGTVLDPFMGSGTTGCATMLEGLSFIGMDREAEYVEIARRRIVDAWERAHV